MLIIPRWFIESSTFIPSSTHPKPEPGKNYFVIHCCLQYPLSRGTVHIASKDPLEKPVVDPQFLSRQTDMDVLLTGTKFVQKLGATETFQNGVIGEFFPAEEGDAELKEYIKDTLDIVFHPVGTAAMLPKDLGGVVDKDLKVYGVDRLRVVCYPAPFRFVG